MEADKSVRWDKSPGGGAGEGWGKVLQNYLEAKKQKQIAKMTDNLWEHFNLCCKEFEYKKGTWNLVMRTVRLQKHIIFLW